MCAVATLAIAWARDELALCSASLCRLDGHDTTFPSAFNSAVDGQVSFAMQMSELAPARVCEKSMKLGEIDIHLAQQWL